MPFTMLYRIADLSQRSLSKIDELNPISFSDYGYSMAIKKKIHF